MQCPVIVCGRLCLSVAKKVLGSLLKESCLFRAGLEPAPYRLSFELVKISVIRGQKLKGDKRYVIS